MVGKEMVLSAVGACAGRATPMRKAFRRSDPSGES